MHVTQIDEGLWRWTAPHPAWAAGKDWDEMVGCIYYEAADDAIVLIDPLAPPTGTPESEKFWAALDRDVERSGLPVATVIANRYHTRSAREVYQRFAGRTGARVWLPSGLEESFEGLATDTFGPGDTLPGGVRPCFVDGLVYPEVALLIPAHSTLVLADAVIGSGEGELRVAPVSWGEETEEGARRYEERFRPSMRELLDLEFDRLIPSHGPPVLGDARAALARALEAPAHGEA
jgi:glyoxylase-like metal-dependent hydrolase (beta-lactamase superfamily II)